jgi:hypothetical protein
MLGAVLGLLHPVAGGGGGGVLRRGLKFQTCRNTLNTFFNNSGNFWVPPRTCTRFVQFVSTVEAIRSAAQTGTAVSMRAIKAYEGG